MRLPIILYDSRFNDGTPSATDTASGYDVLNIRDLRPYTYWQAASSGLKYLTVDCGSAKSADCLGILGHNLSTAGASVVLQNSSDNAAWTPVIAERITADTAFLTEARIFVNGDMEVWSDGTSAAPDGYYYVGAGGSISRDAIICKSGFYSAKIINSSGVCELNQNIGQSGMELAYYGGKAMTFGCWVKSSAPNQARLQLIDNGGSNVSATHSGGGGWEFLTVTRTIAASPTSITLKLQTIDVGTAYFDGVVAKAAASLSSADLSDFIQPQSNAKRYWRLKVADAIVAPRIAVAMVGNKLEFPYPPETPYAPYSEGVEAETSRSKKGHPLGAVVRFKPREISARWANLSRTFVFGSFKTFWDGHASDLKPFFYAEDLDTFPSNVFYVKAKDESKFSTPLSNGQMVDSISLEMEGSRE